MEHIDTFDTVIFKNSKGQTLQDLFYQYDHWEEYVPDKSYEKKWFSQKYKNKIRAYKYSLCIVSNSDGQQKYYVLYERIPHELKELYPFCPCILCRSSRWNPIRYLCCPCCYGCISSGENYLSQSNLSIAKERFRIGRKPFLHWVNFIEYSILFILLLNILYLI